MKKSTWHCIGIMSGTSLDGVDIVYVKFKTNSKLSYEIIHAETIPYTKKWRNKLIDAFNSSTEEINRLDIDYGHYISEITKNFISKYNLNNIDFIASHGHTIFHNPDKGYTLQIGDGKTIATNTHNTVICDFRTQDIDLGGQGAPLVPIGDQLLFSEYDYCINIGGFSNVSYDDNGIRKAFDICPANIVLNYYSRKIGLEYDNKGNLAKQGILNNKLLAALNNLSIYNSKKSMSNEFVISDIIPLIDSFSLPINDVLQTFTEHIAHKIGKITTKKNAQILLTGGGTFNNFMVERIQHYSIASIIIPKKELIDYKEALIFALLGLLRINNKVNVLSSVTGARKDHSSGSIFFNRQMDLH